MRIHPQTHSLVRINTFLENATQFLKESKKSLLPDHFQQDFEAMLDKREHGELHLKYAIEDVCTILDKKCADIVKRFSEQVEKKKASIKSQMNQALEILSTTFEEFTESFVTLCSSSESSTKIYNDLVLGYNDTKKFQDLEEFVSGVTKQYLKKDSVEDQAIEDKIEKLMKIKDDLNSYLTYVPSIPEKENYETDLKWLLTNFEKFLDDQLSYITKYVPLPISAESETNSVSSKCEVASKRNKDISSEGETEIRSTKQDKKKSSDKRGRAPFYFYLDKRRMEMQANDPSLPREAIRDKATEEWKNLPQKEKDRYSTPRVQRSIMKEVNECDKQTNNKKKVDKKEALKEEEIISFVSKDQNEPDKLCQKRLGSSVNKK